MSVERRLREAVRIQTEAAPVPLVDVFAIREQALRQARGRRLIALAAAAATAVIIGTIGGVALTQRTEQPNNSPSGPAGVDPDGVRAFLDRDAGVLHLGGRSIALARCPD